jgi:hypothetical protein
MTSKIITITAITMFLMLVGCTAITGATPTPTTVQAPMLTEVEAMGIVRGYVLTAPTTSPYCIDDEATSRYIDGKWIVNFRSPNIICTFVVDDKTGTVTSQ